MSQVTVRQLAEVVGISIERLIEQLGEAGMSFDDPDASISNSEKTQLLQFLRKSHGKQDRDFAAPNRVTLKRRSVSELKVPAGTGRAKTVNVEVRKKRTYVKRSVIDEKEAADPMREEAQRKLEEVQQERAAKEQEAAAAEAERERKRSEQEEAEAKAAAEAKEKAEALEREKAEEEARLKAEEEARRSEEEARLKAQQERAKQEAAQRESERRKTKRKDTPKKGDTRYGRSELHVAADKSGLRRNRRVKRRTSTESADRHGFSKPTAPVVREVDVPETISVGDLAQRMAVKATEVIKEMMKMGMMATINQTLDQDTAILVVEEMGHTARAAAEKDIEAQLREEYDGAKEDTEVRPPVVTVMGHVDHGKTSLLDHIRKTRVAAGEAGGITQHIGAYHVTTDKGVVSFLDTPGHAAFTAMRARGAQSTDIVILVVAADDGVKPQTIEAIQHARAAEVPMIVAINKVDKPEADIDRAKQELSTHEVISEDWGGEDIFVNVSAMTGEGIDDLLEAILLQAELLELKANPSRRAAGVVVESSLDTGRGPVATVLVQNGTLRQGDMLLAGQEYGRVRAMFNEAGDAIKEAGPSIPTQVLGLSGTPVAGDEVLVVEDERRAKEAAEERQTKLRDARLAQQQAAKLDSLFSQMGEGEVKQVNLLIKADVHGSSEALRDALVKLSNDDVTVNVVSSGVGGITESDAVLAQASNAIVIGFNVRADATARRIIREAEIDLHYYSVIYDALDEVKKAISGVLGTETKEQIVGLAEVKDVFRSSKLGAIAGCIVLEGVVKRMNPIRVLRDNVVIYEGELESLRRFKDDVNEVQSGTECGIGVKQYNDVKPGDQIECFERVEVARTLD
ncbi:MAG: translation initiation factor IF-2 [Pseudomonadota bacterium]